MRNLKKEMELIKDNDKINEKLMILSLYDELFNYVSNRSNNPSLNQYAMENAFELLANRLNMLENDLTINAQKFMILYFELLKTSDFADMFNSKTKKIILKFSNNLPKLIDSNKCAHIIDQFDSIPLEIKVDIMAQFKEYTDKICHSIDETIDEEASKNLKIDILNMLLISLEDYLKGNLKQNTNNNIVSNLTPILMNTAKEYLLNKLNVNELGIENIKDNEIRNIYFNCEGIEQKAWLMMVMYTMIGYDNVKVKIPKEEFCEKLGISKLKFTKISLKLFINFVQESYKMIKKSSINEDSSRKL